MKKLLLIATLLVATAVSVPAGATEISNASLHKLLAAAGIQDLMAQFPHMLRTRMERKRAVELFSPDRLSDDDFRKLEDTMAGAFKPAGIMKAIGDEMKKSLSEEDARQMLAWYDSDLGKKISQAEQDSSMPQASAHSMLADKDRVIFAMKLDKLLHMTDMSMQFQINAATAMAVGYATEKNGHAPKSIQAIKKRIAAGKAKKKYRLRDSVITSSVYTYRNIGVKDLDRYLGFLKSPAALRFNKALMAGMNEGLEQAIRGMARAVENLNKH